MARVRLKTNQGAESVVEFQQSGRQFSATVGEDCFEGEFDQHPDGAGILRLGGRIVPCYFARAGSRIDIWMAGRTHRLELLGDTRRKPSGHAAPISHDISAPMPGTILRIEVQPGQPFVAHQPLIIMESMKMEMTLSAPHAGRIGLVHCSVGELVPMGKVLATLEPQADA